MTPWNSDGVHDPSMSRNAGTVTDSAGGKIEAGGKAETDEGDKKDSQPMRPTPAIPAPRPIPRRTI